MNDADPVGDSQALISVAEFARRQLAIKERQMLSATDLADLQGHLLDDGAGGMIELRTKSSFRHCELEALKDADASEVAHGLVSSIEQSLMSIPN